MQGKARSTMREKIPEMEREVGSANLAAMRLRGTVMHYASVTYVDPGEKILYDSIADAAAGKPILDIGVGGGRTVPHLTAISTNYTAIDYSSEMVTAFAQRFPGLRVLHANAVDLGAFDDASIYLVVFSCCGIDMVGHTDRRKILHEVRRVLAPGGAFIFSTHNLDNRLRDPSIGDLMVPIDPTLNPFKLTRSMAKSVRQSCLRMWNFRKLKHLAERHGDWAILNSEYHAFGTLMHYINVSAQRSELAEAGFAPGPLVYTNEGVPISGATSTTHILHWMARVPELPAPGA
jgi:SAM-dependent methyltransferase